MAVFSVYSDDNVFLEDYYHDVIITVSMVMSSASSYLSSGGAFVLPSAESQSASIMLYGRANSCAFEHTRSLLVVWVFSVFSVFYCVLLPFGVINDDDE